jgi:hypothetical protein
MTDYILLHHDDATQPSDPAAWGPYLAKLRATGSFEGGSSIGPGTCVRKGGTAQPITASVVGYLRVRAENIVAARAFLDGNPVFEAGGTVEIRELPRD